MSAEIASLFLELSSNVAPLLTGLDQGIAKGKEFEDFRASLETPVPLSADSAPYIASLDAAIAKAGEFEAAQRPVEAPTPLTVDTAPYTAGLDAAMLKDKEYEDAQRLLEKPTVIPAPIQAGGGAPLGAGLVGSGAGTAAEAEAARVKAASAGASGSLVSDIGKVGGAAGSMGGILGMAGVSGPMALGAIGVMATHLAGNFEELTTQIVTGAGESTANINMIRQGLLDMSSQVGMVPDELAKGLYNIESAGFHGQQGLDVLRAAAEGAKVGGADMATVADGLTTAMNAYSGSGLTANQVTNDLVATVAAGKMHMQDLAGSLGNILPVAAASHISLAEVSGAIATMTGQGMSADRATNDLANTVGNLNKPSAVAVAAMAAMGLSSTDVSANLGKKGLTGTLDELYQAVMQHMGPAGLVLQDSFNQSKTAATDAHQMISKMPASMQQMAQSFLDGSITQSQWKADLKGLTVDQRDMATQFASMVNHSRGFNDTLKAGGPAAETFNAAMSSMLGGSTGLNTALMLTGDHATTFTANVQGITDATTNGKDSVAGFSDVSQDFNFKFGQLVATGESLLIKVMTPILPVLGKVADAFGKQLAILAPLGVVIGYVAQGFGLLLDGASFAIDFITGKIGGFAGYVQGHLDDIKGFFLGLWHGIEGVGNNIAGFFTALPGRITAAVTALPGLLLQAGKDLIGGLLTGVKAYFDGDMLTWLWDLHFKVLGAIGDAAVWLFDKGKDVIGGLLGGIVSGFEATKTWLKDLPGKIKDAIGDTLPVLQEKGKDLLKGIKFGIEFMWTYEIKPWIESLPGKIKDGLGNLFSTGEAWMRGLWEGIKAHWQEMENWVDDKIHALVHKATHPWEVVIPGGDMGGFAGGAALGAVGGARAGGGSVLGGTSYLVGEKGPEIFTSLSAGTIIPNGGFGSFAGGGGGGSVTVNIHAGAIVVQGSGDPRETAVAMREELFNLFGELGIKGFGSASRGGFAQ